MEDRATSVGTRGLKGKFSSNFLKNGWTNLTYGSQRSTFRDKLLECDASSRRF